MKPPATRAPRRRFSPPVCRSPRQRVCRMWGRRRAARTPAAGKVFQDSCRGFGVRMAGWRADIMTVFRRATQLLWITAVLGAAAGSTVGRAAENKHDLYFCVNLSGQGQVMGSAATVKSGLYRSNDRQNFEHVGFSHIRTFAATYDPREPSTLFVSVLDGVLRGQNRGTVWRRMTGWEMTEPKAIAFDLNAVDHIYAGLPDGIAVSQDRGETWQRMSEGIQRGYTHSLIIDR